MKRNGGKGGRKIKRESGEIMGTCGGEEMEERGRGKIMVSKEEMVEKKKKFCGGERGGMAKLHPFFPNLII